MSNSWKIIEDVHERILKESILNWINFSVNLYTNILRNIYEQIFGNIHSIKCFKLFQLLYQLFVTEINYVIKELDPVIKKYVSWICVDVQLKKF